jgi:hypothetical protein
MRKVLAISLEEVRERFARNARQDLKLVEGQGESAARGRQACGPAL